MDKNSIPISSERTAESQHPISYEPAPTPLVKPDLPKEIGGRDVPEPTRYGDWEKNGRCIDF